MEEMGYSLGGGGLPPSRGSMFVGTLWTPAFTPQQLRTGESFGQGGPVLFGTRARGLHLARGEESSQDGVHSAWTTCCIFGGEGRGCPNPCGGDVLLYLLCHCARLHKTRWLEADVPPLGVVGPF